MQVEVTVPSLLSDCVGGGTTFVLEAATLREALARMLETYPLLRIHLYDETGVLRPHVLIFHNEENTAWRNRPDIPLRAGDRIHVLQAVSGG